MTKFPYVKARRSFALTRELVRLDSSSNGIGQACEAVFAAANELTRVVPILLLRARKRID